MTTTNKDLDLPPRGAPDWDTLLNNNFSIIDSALGGTQPINVTGFAGGPILLTDTFEIVTTPITSMSYIPLRLNIFGVMSADIIVLVPEGVDGMWIVANNTDGAHNLWFGGNGAGGSGSVVYIPVGQNVLCWCDGTDALVVGSITPQSAIAQLADYKFSASPNPQQGWLLCDGQAVSRTTYSALFGSIGTNYGAGDGSTTFNVPDRRGRTGAGMDNMGGTAAGLLPGFTAPGAVGGQASFTLTNNELPSHTHVDMGHTHIDSGHTHTLPNNVLIEASGTGAPGNVGWEFSSETTNTGVANIQPSAANLESTGNGSPFSIVQPTIGDYVFIYSGV